MDEQGFFLQSKVQIPVVSESFVVRQRLVRELENCEQKLVILHAAAGYGKTVLLAHYARSSAQKCVWCHLDRIDNDASVFMYQLTASIKQVIPDFHFVPGPYTILSPEDEHLSLMVRDFILALSMSATGPLGIIFDDFQELVNEIIQSIITQLIDKAPGNIQFFLATKDIIPPSLARHLINQTAKVIPQEILCFTPEEIEFLIQDLVPADLLTATAAGIYENVEGWPAAVMISYIYLERGLPGASLNKLPHIIYQNATISDYLMHEVYRKLPFDLQQFLCRTSILDFMNDDICNCIIGVDNTAHILDYLEQRNLFILRVQDDSNRTYRYHALFKQFLQSRLLAEDRSKILDTAANFYLRTNNREQAVEYAMANNNIPLMQFALESVGFNMLEQSKLDTLERWLFYLQQQEATITARNLLLKAAFEQRIGQPEAALANIDHAIAMFLSSMDENGYISSMILKSQIVRDSTSFEDSCTILYSLLPPLNNKPVAAVYEVYREIFFNYIFMGKFEDAHTACQSLLVRARAAGDKKTEARLQKFSSLIYYGQGEYSLALQLYYDAALTADSEYYSVRFCVACMELYRGNTELARKMIDDEINTRLALNKLHDLWLIYSFQALIYALCAIDVSSTDEIRLSDLAKARQAQRMAMKYASFCKTNRFFSQYVNTANQLLSIYLDRCFSSETVDDSIIQLPPSLDCLQEMVWGARLLFLKTHLEPNSLEGTEVPIATSFFSAAALALYILSLLDAGERESAVIYARDLFAYAARQDIRFLFTGFASLRPLVKLAVEESIEPLFIANLGIPARDASSHRLIVHCFGDFEVCLTGQEEPVKFRTKKAQEVFAYFIHLNNSQVSKDKLLELMWPDSTKKQATSLLHTTLYSIRKALPDRDMKDLIGYKNKKYFIDMRMIDSDLNEMWQLCRAMENRDMKTVDAKLPCLEKYQGSYLSNLECDWSMNRNEYFERMYLKLRQYAATRDMEEGRYDAAIYHLQKAMEVDPFIERLYVLLMRCYHELGNLSGIHNQYKKLTNLLARELDIAPAPETCEAYYALTGTSPTN